MTLVAVIFLLALLGLLMAGAMRRSSRGKRRSSGDGSMAFIAGSDTGGSRKGHGDSDGRGGDDSSDGGGDGGGGGD